MSQAFYPNERFVSADKAFITGDGCALAVISEMENGVCRAFLYERGRLLSKSEEVLSPFLESGAPDRRKAVKRTVYRAFLTHTGFKPPWGSFTGIRPSKIVHEKWKEGFTDGQIAEFMTETYDMDADRIALCFEVARAERVVLSRAGETDFALYVGVPFCPSRCLYCSFTSFEAARYQGKTDAYVDALLKEMAGASGFGHGKRLESVYVGGGTPTSLTAAQLERLLAGVREHFDIDRAAEFTVEAGRPDTITREKLAVMKNLGVTRISINPQTMNDATLERIGRGHTAGQFSEAFELARDLGFSNINVDLIAGLPGEDAGDAARTMARISELAPENLTVHTLAVKRASRLWEAMIDGEMPPPGGTFADAMIAETRRGAKAMGMHPYCMYRQKNMVGHFENVGYCLPGFESAYNVQILVERQSILALGAGAVTKLYRPETNRLERVFNVKNVDDYMNRIDEMISRKQKLLENVEMENAGKPAFSAAVEKEPER